MKDNGKVLSYSRFVASENRKKKLESLQCDDCKEFPIDIYSCSDECGKTYCKKYFKSYQGKDKICLKENCGLILIEDNNIDYIKERIKCINENEGCSVKCFYGDLNKHEKICEYQKKNCQFCNKLQLSNDFENHILTCDERIEKCENCKLDIRNKNLDVHIDKECSERKIQCNLCQKIFKINLMNEHFKNCEFSEVKCLNCTNLILKKNLISHTCNVNLDNLKIALSIEELKIKTHNQGNIILDIQTKVDKIENKIISQEKNYKTIISNFKIVNDNIIDLKKESEDNKQIFILLYEEIKNLNNKILNPDDAKKCQKCKERKKQNFCSKCRYKFCDYCTNRCSLCCAYLCIDCSIRLKSCNQKCSNYLCNECFDTFKLLPTSTTNPLFYYGLICEETKCIHCNKMKTCSLCNVSCCVDCFRKCTICPFQDKICCTCFKSFETSISLNSGSTQSLKCNHREFKEIYFGCVEGSIIKYNYKREAVIGEIKSNQKDNQITSLINFNFKNMTQIAYTNVDGGLKIIKNLINNNHEKVFEKKITNDTLQILKISEGKLALMYQYSNKKVEIINFGSQINSGKIFTSKQELYSFTNYDDDSILIGKEDNTLSLWNHSNGNVFNLTTGHIKLGEKRSGIYNTVKLVNGKYKNSVVTAGADKIIKIWNVSSEKAFNCVFTGNVNIYAGWMFKVKELIDGRIVFCAYDKQVKLFDLNSNVITNSLAVDYKTFDYLVLNENLLLTISEDSNVRTWDIRKNFVVSQFQLDNYPVRELSNSNSF